VRRVSTEEARPTSARCSVNHRKVKSRVHAYPDFTGTRSIVDPNPVICNQNDHDSNEEVGLDDGDKDNRSNDLSQRSNEHPDSVTENVVDGIHVYMI